MIPLIPWYRFPQSKQHGRISIKPIINQSAICMEAPSLPQSPSMLFRYTHRTALKSVYWKQKKTRNHDTYFPPASPNKKKHNNHTWMAHEPSPYVPQKINELKQQPGTKPHTHEAWQPFHLSQATTHKKGWKKDVTVECHTKRSGKKKSNIPSFQPSHFVLIFILNANLRDKRPG